MLLRNAASCSSHFARTSSMRDPASEATTWSCWLRAFNSSAIFACASVSRRSTWLLSSFRRASRAVTTASITLRSNDPEAPGGSAAVPVPPRQALFEFFQPVACKQRLGRIRGGGSPGRALRQFHAYAKSHAVPEGHGQASPNGRITAALHTT